MEDMSGGAVGVVGWEKEEMDELVVDINVIIQYRIGLSRVNM